MLKLSEDLSEASKELTQISEENTLTINSMGKELQHWHDNLSLFSCTILSVYIDSSKFLSSFYFENKINKINLSITLKLITQMFDKTGLINDDRRLCVLVKNYKYKTPFFLKNVKLLSEFIVEFQKELNNIIFTAPRLKKDLYLFQGTKLGKKEFIKKLKPCKDNDLNPDISTLQNVLSTSVNQKVSSRFIGKPSGGLIKGALCCINIFKYPKGMPFAMIQTQNNEPKKYTFGGNKKISTYNEEEVLLPQGLKINFACTYMINHMYGQKIYDLKVISVKIIKNKDIVVIKNNFIKEHNVIDYTTYPFKAYIEKTPKKCTDDKILNTKTNRCVKKTGKLGIQILNEKMK